MPKQCSLRGAPLLQQFILRQKFLSWRSLHIVSGLHPSRIAIELALLLGYVLCILVMTLGVRNLVGIVQVLLLNVRIDLISCAADDLSSWALVVHATRNIEGVICGVCRVRMCEFWARVLLIWPRYGWDLVDVSSQDLCVSKLAYHSLLACISRNRGPCGCHVFETATLMRICWCHYVGISRTYEIQVTKL